MHKIILVFIFLFYPLPLLPETKEEIGEKCLSSFDDPTCLSSDKSQIKIRTFTKVKEKKNNIAPKYKFNQLSQYGIVDYASAVSWCRKNISQNHYEYKLQIDRIYSHPADFCRRHFIPSLQSKSGRICVECDLEPNLILANLIEAINKPNNNYGSNFAISEEVYSERNLNQSNYSIDKKISEQTEEKSKNLITQTEENNKSFSDQTEETIKRAYFTGSVGLSKIRDINVRNIDSDIEFDAGLGLGIGIGYDFGKNRFEASLVTGQSDGVSWLGYTIESDSKIDSLLVSYYYDFRYGRKLNPFIGTSIGTTNVDINGVGDTGLTYGFGYGLSYKSSEVIEVFIKGQTMVVPKLEFGTISIENGSYTNITFGIRFRF